MTFPAMRWSRNNEQVFDAVVAGGRMRSGSVLKPSAATGAPSSLPPGGGRAP